MIGALFMVVPQEVKKAMNKERLHLFQEAFMPGGCLPLCLVKVYNNVSKKELTFLGYLLFRFIHREGEHIGRCVLSPVLSVKPS